MDLLVQLITGAVGGLGAGKALPKFSLGNVGNMITGLVGGGIGGQLLTQVLGTSLSGGGSELSGMLEGAAGSGVGGGALMVVIGLVKNAMSGKAKA